MPLALNLWPFAVGAAELLCSHEISATDERQRRYLSHGIDPQFRLNRRLPAGWYMLEAVLDLPASACVSKLFFNTGTGESEECSYPMPVRSGRMAKRLIHLPATAAIRFDPCQQEGALTLRHFRLVRLTRQAALQRMRAKLARPEVHPAPWKLTEAILWNSYKRLFAERTAGHTIAYHDWIAEREQPALPTPEQRRALIAGWSWRPMISVLVPTSDANPAHLRACLDSVLDQTYPHWELCIAADDSALPQVRQMLDAYQARDARVRVVLGAPQQGAVAASNAALALASGDFIALLDQHDVLAPQALLAVTEALQQRPSARLIYSDEDQLDPRGERCEPFFKPDFARDLLYSQNYVAHLGVYQRELACQLGGFRAGTDGSQNYDLVLRCVARTPNAQDIVHVPAVLYHRRQAEPASGTSDAARQVLQAHFDGHHPGVEVSVVEPGLYRHHWPLADPKPLVTLIVPTRDSHDLLRSCLESVLQKTAYASYEILVVDNQSTCVETLAYLGALQLRPNVRVLHYDGPFNFSAINNLAARHARGSILGLLNNDVEVIGAQWLDEMVRHAVRADIGCVGAKLFFPDDSIQHAGVVLGIGGVAGHSHKHLPRDIGGYFNRLRIVHNVSAVTAAALLVRKEVFEEVGGFDEEHLTVAYNDVDLCLKVLSAGYRNLWTPYAELYHHESKTRGADDTPQKQARFKAERAVMLERWGRLLADDPYYNPNLTLIHEDYSLAGIPRPRRA